MTDDKLMMLLPLPEPNGSYTNPYDADDLTDYASANVERATWKPASRSPRRDQKASRSCVSLKSSAFSCQQFDGVN